MLSDTLPCSRRSPEQRIAQPQICGEQRLRDPSLEALLVNVTLPPGFCVFLSILSFQHKCPQGWFQAPCAFTALQSHLKAFLLSDEKHTLQHRGSGILLSPTNLELRDASLLTSTFSLRVLTATMQSERLPILQLRL